MGGCSVSSPSASSTDTSDCALRGGLPASLLPASQSRKAGKGCLPLPAPTASQAPGAILLRLHLCLVPPLARPYQAPSERLARVLNPSPLRSPAISPASPHTHRPPFPASSGREGPAVRAHTPPSARALAPRRRSSERTCDVWKSGAAAARREGRAAPPTAWRTCQSRQGFPENPPGCGDAICTDPDSRLGPTRRFRGQEIRRRPARPAHPSSHPDARSAQAAPPLSG